MCGASRNAARFGLPGLEAARRFPGARRAAVEATAGPVLGDGGLIVGDERVADALPSRAPRKIFNCDFRRRKQCDSELAPQQGRGRERAGPVEAIDAFASSRWRIYRQGRA